MFGLGLLAVASSVAVQFVAALTVSVFVYYSTRPLYEALDRLSFWRFGLPRRVRAAIALMFFSLPLLFLLGYTMLLLLSELQVFVEDYPVMEALGDASQTAADLEQLPELTPSGLLDAYRSGELDGVIEFTRGNLAVLANAVTSFLLNVLIVLVATYYLLIDGHKFGEWLVKFDEDEVVRTYVEVADRELSKVLFGNLLTIIVIGVAAVVVYTGYNFVVPSAAEIPYPALAGALTGVASLVPAVGMKVVYVPLAGAVAVNAFLAGDLDLLWYVAGFLAVVAVVVDTIPDLVLRPYLSGKYTHVGLLMLAYIFGTVVWGFYGLFLAPIVLVLSLTFVYVVLPFLAGEDVPPSLRRPDEETTLAEHFEAVEEEEPTDADDGLFWMP